MYVDMHLRSLLAEKACLSYAFILLIRARKNIVVGVFATK